LSEALHRSATLISHHFMWLLMTSLNLLTGPHCGRIHTHTHTHTHTVRRAHTILMCHVYAILAMQPATARCWWWRGRVLIATTPPPPTGCARMIVLHAHIKRGIFCVLRARKSCVHMELPAHRALCLLSVCLSCILCVRVCVCECICGVHSRHLFRPSG